jgi:hypothetical protein
MQGYCRSGGFSPLRRLKDGVIENIWFYTMIGVPSIAFVLYAIFGLKIPASLLLDLAIPASNAYGLLLLTILMSFGLVEIPRGLWYSSSTEWKLKIIESEIPQLKESCVDSEAEVYEVARLVALASQKISQNDPNRPKLDKILEKCPLALNERHAVVEDGTLMEFNEKTLSLLHARIKRAQYINKRQHAKLKIAQDKAFFYQDILANYSNTQKLFDSPFLHLDDDGHKLVKQKVLWWWYCRLQPIALKFLSIICAIASIMIIWSESTFQFTGARLSFPAMILDPNTSTFIMELLAFGFVSYMGICTFSTLLRIKIFDFYQMVPYHNTDEPSLLFVGAYFCKLTFPLCYNFLNMGGVADGKQIASGVDYSRSPVFIQYFGPAVNLTPLFGQGYNDWVAFLILIVCIIFLLNIHGRVLRLLGITNYLYESVKPNDRNAEEGRRIVEQGTGLFYLARSLELRRLQREDRQPQRSAVPRARNTADLLESYRQRGVDVGRGRTVTASEPVEEPELPTASRSTRSFGLPIFSKKTAGYQKLGG